MTNQKRVFVEFETVNRLQIGRIATLDHKPFRGHFYDVGFKTADQHITIFSRRQAHDSRKGLYIVILVFAAGQTNHEDGIVFLE